ncbi:MULTISPECIES: DUF7333 family protein [Haloferax]|nr:hypothetical protein [Haloferax mediterranei]AFK18578.2 hypothetical protein HFX_0857 [Haloferax mediterranei ATCC 33500]AHZ22046.1 hypothetical protein BM92_04950 [Haloferax mediterranei ATCC 33500]MDX5988667.1 hypothetical protein [Haloferax mediterranei ATCC 33500]
MEFDLTKTVALLVGLVVLGTAALIGMGVMETNTVLMMVTPAMLAFGVICLAIGVKHGEYRTAN